MPPTQADLEGFYELWHTEGTDLSAHPCSLINTYTVHLHNHLRLLNTSKYSKDPDQCAHKHTDLRLPHMGNMEKGVMMKASVQ